MNRIHKVKYRNTTSVKRVMAFIFALFLMIGSVMVPNIEARADSLSVRASASSVKIGDTVTISITVPAGVSATVHLTYPNRLFTFVSASETANSNGGTVSMTLGGYGGTDTATTGTMTFRATAAGSATFSASAPVAGNQVGDPVSVGGGSATVTVQNEAGGGGSGGNSGGGNSGGNSENNGGGSSGGNHSGGNNSDNDDDDDDEGDSERKSADNSLSSLTLSEGKLSPDFKYNVVNYTATVDYSVTSVVVSAKVSNEKATIESVTGGNNLKVGDNRIQIVVKAENGVTATYTITVTRRAQGEAGEEPPSDDPIDTPATPAEKSYVVNGKTLYPASEMPEGVEAEGFVLGEIALWDQTYPAYADTFASGELRLVYLTEENGENGGLYLLFANSPYEAYDYVCLHSEKGFVIVLPDGNGAVPSAYSNIPVALNIEDYGSVDAWFMQNERDTALIYAINQLGAKDWYVLDTADLSYMRYREPAKPAEAEVVDEPSTEQGDTPSADPKEMEKLRKQNRLIIGAAVIAVLILLVVIVLMAVAKRGGNDPGDDILDLDDTDSDLATDSHKDSDFGTGKDPGADPRKRYAKSMFSKDSLTNTNADDETDTDTNTDTASVTNSDTEESEFSALEAGLADAIARELAAEGTEKEKDTEKIKEKSREMMDISNIADPAPMQTVATHKDEDDDDLEFIDL